MNRGSAKIVKDARLWTAAILLAGVAMFWAPAISAGDHKHGDHHDKVPDHDQAREALIRGEIAPLEKVLASIRPEVDGDFVGAELEIESDVWVYDLKFIDRHGVLRKIHVDAKSAKILSRDAHK